MERQAGHKVYVRRNKKPTSVVHSAYDIYSGETSTPTQENVQNEFPQDDVYSKDDIRKAKLFLKFMGADINYKADDITIFQEFSYLCSQHPD